MSEEDRKRAQVAELRGAGRMDTFVDTAFGFAVTLLVISGGSMPLNGQQMTAALLHVPAFLMSFAMVARIWLSHRSWSARYGFYDTTSTMLTFALVAFMLIFIFPLHAMFEAFASFASGGFFPSRFVLGSMSDLKIVFTAFGAMFVAFGLVLSSLYFRAWELRDTAGLSRAEAFAALGDAIGLCWMAILGVGSIVLTQIFVVPDAPVLNVIIPPSLYVLMWLISPISRTVRGRGDASS